MKMTIGGSGIDTNAIDKAVKEWYDFHSNHDVVSDGDLVEFMGFGALYVVDASHPDYFLVTDKEEDRYNKKADTIPISKNLVFGVIDNEVIEFLANAY